MRTPTYCIRAALVVIAMAAVFLFGTTRTASAQVIICPSDPCPCDASSITINPNLTCKIELCELTPSGFVCTTYVPGKSFFIECETLNQLRFRDCYGNLICLPKPGESITCVCAAPGCCVDLYRDSAVPCFSLRIEPSACLGC